MTGKMEPTQFSAVKELADLGGSHRIPRGKAEV
jgi:hypothetical protein